MFRHAAYQQLAPTGATRIELLLAVFDAAVQRLSAAREHLQRGEDGPARSYLQRAQLFVGELVAGVRVDPAPELGANLLRLYEYVLHQLDRATVDSVDAALVVLQTLREGFEAIRPEAVRLERAGQIPAADTTPAVTATA